MEDKILSLIILVFVPLVALLFIISPLCPTNNVFVRRFSKGFSGLHFLYSLLFLLNFNPNLFSMSYQQELLPLNNHWIKTMGITATFAVDGLSLALCVLISFLFFIALIISKYTINKKYKFYYSMVFLLQTSILGIFCAKDVFLLFLFWVLAILPLFFLISIYSSEEAKKNSIKYILINYTGSIFILFSLLILYYYNFTVSGVLTANIEALNFDEYSYPIWFQFVTFAGFFIGFILKMQIMPFHFWVIDVQKTLPSPINILMVATSLPLGLYGLARFNMIVFPTAFKEIAVFLMIIAVVNIIFAAIKIHIITNLKEIVSYISIFQAGFVLFGISTVSKFGFTGAVLQVIAYSFIIPILFILAEIIIRRTKYSDFDDISGIAKKMPKLFFVSMPIIFATIGAPFFAVFPAQFLIMIGAFTTDLYEQMYFQFGVVVVLFALLFMAAALMKILHKMFFANVPVQFDKITDISVEEFMIFFIFLIPIVYIGIAPMSVINLYNSVVSIMMEILRI